MIALEKDCNWKAPATTGLEATISLELCPGLPAREADRRIAQACRAGDIGARTIAFYLVDMADRGAQQELGFANVVHYAHTRFGIQPSTAREYMAVGRALLQLSMIDGANCSGRIGWSKTRLLVRIATAQTEGAWVEWAANHTVRELEAQARLRRGGELPTDPSRRRIHEPCFPIQAKLNLIQYQVWSNARQKLCATTGRAVSDVECMVEGAAAFLRAASDGAGCGQPVNDSHFKVLVHHDSKTGRTDMDTVDGRVELDGHTAAAILREAGRDDLVRKPDPNCGPEVDPEKRDAPATPQMRAMILARDGCRCLCCWEMLNLTVHHIWWLIFGGPTAPWNLATLCEDCHSLVHARLLFIEGEPGANLRFTDAEGRELTAGPPVGESMPALRNLSPPAGTGIPPATATVEVDARASSLTADLPDRVDAEWLARNGHMLTWNDRQGTLEFQPGMQVAAPLPSVDARASRGDDARASRPASLADVVGQRQAVNNLRRAAQAARRLGEPMPHILLAGPPGLGKTSLARAVAAEAGTGFHAAAGPVILEPGVLLRLMGSLAEGDILFLDEIHRLPARVAETLYEAMEDWSLSLPVRCGSRQRTLHVRLPRFTLIGATSQQEMLSTPLLGRFQIREYLEFYGCRDLARILRRAAARMKVGLNRDAAAALADASRGTPRESLALLRSARDEAVLSDRSSIDASLAARTLRSLGIDELGLRAPERRYLDVLREARRPVGLTTLAGRLGESRDTIQRAYEPYLLRRGLVNLTPFGRALATPLRR